MELWETGDIGSHKIKKVEGQAESGYPSVDTAQGKMLELKKEGNWELNEGDYDFTIMQLYW